MNGPVEVDVDGFERALADPPVAREDEWRAWLVSVAPNQSARFRRACAREGISCRDPIAGQLAELARVRFPGESREHVASRQQLLRTMVGESEDSDREASRNDPAPRRRDAVGRWAWLPWKATVVHVLDRDDFHDVITSRNRDKIDRHEQQELRRKRVGIMGLSVGGEAAVAVAQEHLCGAIVLADFDRLELSNLNRLGAGVDDLGVNKAALVARRIAAIDPYLRVDLFPEGVTDETVGAFLDGLDLLLEECDDLRMKYFIRVLAKQRAIDVVYAADERGFLSVEPYSSAPELEPFHGIVRGAHPPRAAFASERDFYRTLTEWVGGWDSISQRSRESLERLGITTCGYPQLSSEARLAAGILGNVARRLLLGERVAPAVQTIDLDGLVPAKPEHSSED